MHSVTTKYIYFHLSCPISAVHATLQASIKAVTSRLHLMIALIYEIHLHKNKSQERTSGTSDIDPVINMLNVSAIAQSISQSMHPCFAVGSDEHLFDWCFCFSSLSANQWEEAGLRVRKQILNRCQKHEFPPASSPDTRPPSHTHQLQFEWGFTFSNLSQWRRSTVSQPQVRNISAVDWQNSTSRVQMGSVLKAESMHPHARFSVCFTLSVIQWIGMMGCNQNETIVCSAKQGGGGHSNTHTRTHTKNKHACRASYPPTKEQSLLSDKCQCPLSKFHTLSTLMFWLD